MLAQRTDKASCLRYRIAYGAAANLLEASKYDHSFGRAYAGKVGGQDDRYWPRYFDRSVTVAASSWSSAVNDASRRRGGREWVMRRPKPGDGPVANLLVKQFSKKEGRTYLFTRF